MRQFSESTPVRLLLTAFALLVWWAMCWFGAEAYFARQEAAYPQEVQRAENFAAGATQGFDRIVSVRIGFVVLSAGGGGTLLILLFMAAWLRRGERNAGLHTLRERAELEQRQSQFFRLAPGFFYTLVRKPDGGCAMPFASAGIRELFGLDPDDVAQSCAALIALIHPDDSEKMFGKLDEPGAGMPSFHFECRIFHPAKGLRWMEGHSLHQRTPDGGVRWDGFMLDITERKHIDDALCFVAQRGWMGSAKKFFDALALYLGETLGVDYVVIGRLEREADSVETVALYAQGTIVQNIRYSLGGTPCENVTGREFCFYSQGIRQMFPEDALLVDMGAESYAGIPLWDSVGEPIGLISVLDSKPLANKMLVSQLLQFIATRAAAEMERERSERILRERERSFRSLAENAPDNIVRFDRAGRIVYANPVFEQLSGVPAEELLGKTPAEVLPAGLFDDLANRVRQVFATGEPVECFVTLPGQDEAGGERCHHLCLTPERDEGGEIHGILSIGRDITELKRYETEREAVLTEAVRLAKLRSDFLAHMSHELRTPLNGILGYAQILQRDKTLGERNASALNVIRQSGEHLLALIDDTLDLTRIESGRLELVNSDIPLPRFLRVVAEIVGVRARQKRLEFSCDLASDLPEGVRGDERRLRQVLLNLLSNAVKFTDHGHVVLRVQRVGTSRISFVVEDSGIGIDAGELESIFQPFEQAADAQHQFGGTGLGLAISRQLVRLMGGDIAVESRIGEGSIFRFELELPEVSVASSAAQSAADYAGPRRKVLVADDVPHNRAILIDLLAPMGFEVIEACDGIEALELAQSTLPDIILMDIVMPGMGGLEAIRHLRKLPQLADIPVVVLSASAADGDEEACMKLGASAFLLKPVDPDELLAQMALLLHLEWATMPPIDTVTPIDKTAGPLIVPPLGEMQTLHRLALLGNMRDIVRFAEHIAGLDPGYRAFAAHLHQLANGFRSKAILAFIEEHLPGQQHQGGNTGSGIVYPDAPALNSN